MILFSEDWGKYPDAMVVSKTTNPSFIQYALILKRMGVKNHAFPLALVNPDLHGINPHDPGLSQYEMELIAIECSVNPWFYFRECSMVPAQAGEAAIHIAANRGNICLWWLYFNHITNLLTQIRQTGKSLSSDSLMAYLLNIGCQNTTINLLTKDETLRMENISRLKKIMDEMPAYLRLRTKADADNTQYLTINALGNKYYTHLPRSSEKDAYKVGRGLSSPTIQVDEGPFMANIGISLESALGGMGAMIERAKRSGAHYGVILTTTAGMIDDPSGSYFWDMIGRSARFSEALFDARNQEDLYKIVVASSRSTKNSDGELRIYSEFNHRQLGKTDQWLRETLQLVGVKGAAADRDFFNRWNSGTNISPFSVEDANRVARNKREALHVQICRPHAYSIRWHIAEEDREERMATGKFIMGKDPSDMGGGDDLGMVIRDIGSGEVVAAATYNESNTLLFSMWLADFLEEYPNIIVNIERRSSGAAILDNLLMMLPAKGIDPFKRLFNWVVNDSDEHRDRYNEINMPMDRRNPDVYIRFKKYFGFATSGSGRTARGELYSTTLINAIRSPNLGMYDPVLIDQTLGLENRNGRIDHGSGRHDDVVIAFLLTEWFLRHAKNLKFYGVDLGKLRAVASLSKAEDPIATMKAKEQEAIRTRVERLMDKLKRESDENLSMLLEHQLRSLSDQLEDDEFDAFSVDEMLKQIRKDKRTRHRDRSSKYGQNGFDSDFMVSKHVRGYSPYQHNAW